MVATVMIVTVAAIERAESRAIPQRPRPEVQPEARLTPTPTRYPPISIPPKSAASGLNSVFHSVPFRGPAGPPIRFHIHNIEFD